MTPSVVPIARDAHRGDSFFPLFSTHLGAVLAGFWSADECKRAALAVCAARSDWNSDFGGEQFSLGRAFYTHFEEDRSSEYFDGAKTSDALVERCLPGMQRSMIDLVATLVGGTARPRRGWCGPGVHVFPAGEWVARQGGVVHFDTEGLSERHIQRRVRALTVVLMVQPPERGGGLRLWDVAYEGRDEARADELERPSIVSTSAAGDVLVMDSYRLHQIQPFDGPRDRISITAHAAELDPGLWEVWF